MVFAFKKDKSKAELLDAVYLIGSIYMSVNSASLSTYFGGTWVSWVSGQVSVGVNTSDSDFSAAKKTGGEKSHTLTFTEMPSHRHTMGGMCRVVAQESVKQ